jgi:hypothetical protein
MLLAEEDLPGEVRLLLWPSGERRDEESKTGAMRGVDAVVGQQMDEQLETGHIHLSSGPLLELGDSFEVAVRGGA